ncbi:MAG: TonB family protein [Acidobacteriia bacterium]|nr:TonB family protein [Terriglobia bacterium]
MLRHILAISILISVGYSQSVSPGDVYRIGSGVSAPTPIRRPEPKYSPEARTAGTQGSILFTLVVDEQGLPTNIRVLTPIGFGLDELALETISQWRFKPGLKDGKAVKVAANIEINFRIESKASDSRNQLIHALQQLQGDPKQKEGALRDIQGLAHKKLPEAMYVYAKLLSAGKEIPPDPTQSRDLMARAAEAKYGPAMFTVASASMEQTHGANLESTKEVIRSAANLGSNEAQYFLGSVYEKGNSELGFQQDDDSALHYYRLCAAAGQAPCQFRLGELLLNDRRREHVDIAEAIAWLELSTNQGETRARSLGERERASLAPEDIKRVEALKRQLVRRNWVSWTATPAGTR